MAWPSDQRAPCAAQETDARPHAWGPEEACPQCHDPGEFLSRIEETPNPAPTVGLRLLGVPWFSPETPNCQLLSLRIASAAQIKYFAIGLGGYGVIYA